MEQVTELLKELAKQMGTTAEYLWAALIKQARIDAAISLIQMLITLPITYFVINYGAENYAQWHKTDSEWMIAVFVVAGMILGGASIVMLIEIPNILTSFINREYWALNKVLSKLGKKD